ncbi:BMP family ABC transporter substrate-binding protein [Alkalihalobacterium alkalicellulosilyticum]|uniref:BMP family ABC transporter substrate-binding protein n=1 Tax=Alkalihalobacterium alkalicellulosilyticum TaxID=1912214 RepID=UPI00099890FE|nr:BMP family ABC transporter substrate-binding protein [Bacillus alkalicellulosilyticus]
MSQSKLSKKIVSLSIAISFILIVTLGFSIFALLQPNTKAVTLPNQLVGIITSDTIHDQSWGSLAYKGKLLIIENHPVTVELMSEQNTDEKMLESTLKFIEDGAKLIIGHGREFSPLFTELAPSYEDIHFVTINGDSEHNNQSVFTTNPYSYGYMAGMVAALLTNNNKIALLQPHEPEDKTQASFEMAIKEFNPKAAIYIEELDTRDDEENAVRITEQLINQGVDLIFSTGNAYNRAVIHAAKEANIMVIGFIDDQQYMAKNHVITSLVIDIPNIYNIILEQHLSETGIIPGLNVLDFRDDIYQLAPFGPMVSNDVIDKINTQLTKYNEGEFEIINSN